MVSPEAPALVAGPRLTRIAAAVAVALALAFAFSVLDAEGSSTSAGRLGGDFASFYASGRIVAEGDVEQLYDADRLQAEQHERDLLGDEEDGYVAFPYPPYIAAAYQPLSALPYRAAYAVHTVLMVAALAGALLLARPMLPVLGANIVVATVAALAFFPMFRAIGGGQNTSLSLLLLVAVWRAVHDDRDALAGVALGVLLYKPQLAVPVLGLLVVVRRWRVLAGFVPVAAAVWAVNAAIVDAGWVTWWLEGVSDWSALEAEFNADNTISLPGVAETLFDHGTLAARAVGWSLAAVVVGLLVALWWRWRTDGKDLALPVGAATAGVLLLSPHAVYYEAGLLVLTGAVLLDRGTLAERRWVGALWLAGWLHPLNGVIGVTPLFAVAVVAFAVAAVAVVRRMPAAASVIARR